MKPTVRIKRIKGKEYWYQYFANFSLSHLSFVRAPGSL